MALSLGLGIGLTRGQGGFSLAAFMASQSDGFWLDFGDASRLFQNTDEATPVTATGQVIGRANDRRTGANSPRNATQATGSFKPTLQTTGAKFDGTDDRLPTGYAAGAGANFIVARVTAPASLPSSQVIAGSNTVTSGRFQIGVNSSGNPIWGAGDANGSAPVDVRGQSVVIGLSFNLTSVRFLVLGVEYTASKTADPTTSVAVAVGSGNHNGTPGSFWAQDIRSIVAGREFIDLARFNQIAAALMAA